LWYYKDDWPWPKTSESNIVSWYYWP
jgi:hypothetical protein